MKTKYLLFVFAAVLPLILFSAPHDLNEEEKLAAHLNAQYVAPKLSVDGSWSMVIVPDVQGYNYFARNQGLLQLMIDWIVDNRELLKIQQVLFTGDLVYQNNTGSINIKKNLVCREQWKSFSRVMERIDGELPYILCTGNHDYGIRGSENTNTHFNEYFPSDRNPLTRRQLVECAPNRRGVPTLENAIYQFTAPHPDNRKFLVISLQNNPADKTIKWAKSIVDKPEFANHFCILLTHNYLTASGERSKIGETIYQQLVFPVKNIRLVVCGHICKPFDWDSCVAFSKDKNSSGKTVAQMVFNTQDIEGGWGNGGNGWLRLLEFMPDKKTVKARTFSPFFAISRMTRYLAWRKDGKNEFSFELE